MNERPLIKQNIELILASTSPVRRQILSDAGLEFKVTKPEFDEEAFKEKIKKLTIKDQALFLARGKALSISLDHPNSVVIASDQICQLGRKTISKSNNSVEAVRQLQELNGKTHYQNNAICVYQGKKELFFH